MTKQRAMQHFEACNEVSYIQSVNPQNPGQSFNHDPSCFASYREMQAKHAEVSGHTLQAQQMRMRGSWA